MELHVQYANSADGVSIACYTLGQGPPLVLMPMGPRNFRTEWRLAESRRFHERLAQRRQVVRYDLRGSGLSQRGAVDFAFEAQVRDLEAVVERLRARRADLFAGVHAGPIAIAFTARHPERVSRLILWCTWTHRFGIYRPARSAAIQTLIDADWELFIDSVAHSLLGRSGGALSRSYAEVFRDATTPEEYDRWLEGNSRVPDVGDLLTRVNVPTLVLHRREVDIEVEVARGIAARIPGSEFALLEGDSTVPFVGDSESVTAAIEGFLERGGPAGLSEREIEVLRHLARGQTNQEIADELVISLNTVNRHVSNIFNKIDVTNRAEAVAFAFRQGMVP